MRIFHSGGEQSTNLREDVKCLIDTHTVTKILPKGDGFRKQNEELA